MLEQLCPELSFSRQLFPKPDLRIIWQCSPCMAGGLGSRRQLKKASEFLWDISH